MKFVLTQIGCEKGMNLTRVRAIAYPIQRDCRNQKLFMSNYYNKSSESEKSKPVRNSAGAASFNHDSVAVIKDNRPNAVQPISVNAPIQNKNRPPFKASSGVNPVQRLVVHTSHGTLKQDMLRPDAGWITSSTLQVALDHGPPGQDIIEFAELGTYQNLGKNENIYFVGHGRDQSLGVKSPQALAASTKLALPEDYSGQIISLNCSSGQGVEASAIHQFTERLSVENIMVEGPRGPSLHHPDIPGKVRVVIPTHVSKVGDWIKLNQAGTQAKWKTERNKVITSSAYSTADNAGKIRLLAAASVALSSDFYKELVIWADNKGYLYGLDESHTASTVVSE